LLVTASGLFNGGEADRYADTRDEPQTTMACRASYGSEEIGKNQ